MEMQCYCDQACHPNINCENTISYVHHHDWGSSEDFMCEDCLNNCEKE